MKKFFTQFKRHISFLWHWKNFFFLLKYPFWKSYNRWNGAFMGYYYTEYEAIPCGWRKAFGKELTKELKEAIKKEKKRIWKEKHKIVKTRDLLRWEQIKEKYGTLRLYCGTTREINKVIRKYELLSQAYCIECGAPARYCTNGWIEFLCEDCFDRELVRRGLEKYSQNYNELKEDARLKEEDIPISTSSLDGDLIKYYDLDFYKLWGLIKKDDK